MPPEPERPRPEPIAGPSDDPITDVLGTGVLGTGVLATALPPACVAGVAANLRLLGDHWARLSQPADPAAWSPISPRMYAAGHAPPAA